MDKIVTHVMCEVFDAATSRFVERSVPVSEIAAFHSANNTAKVTRVVWKDGSSSWAKAWHFRNSGVLARIGAGAYGDFEVWRHPDYDALSQLARRAA